MRRFLCRVRDLLGEHPLTCLGVALGVAFAVVFWTRQDATNREVQRITERVVVVERQQGAARATARLTCSTAHPHSRACRTLARTIVHVQHAQAHRHVAARRSPARRPQAPSAPRRTTAPPHGAPAPQKAPTALAPAAPVQAHPAPPAPGASVDVKPDASVGVRTPDVTVTTPAGDLHVPAQDVTVGPLP